MVSSKEPKLSLIFLMLALAMASAPWTLGALLWSHSRSSLFGLESIYWHLSGGFSLRDQETTLGFVEM